jgi:hypothetical protein
MPIKVKSQVWLVVGVVEAEHGTSREPLQDGQRTLAEAALSIVNDVQI